MTFKLLDVVVSTVTLSDSGVMEGMVGTVVEVFAEDAFEVEFCDDDGVTIAMLPMQPSQIVPLDFARQRAQSLLRRVEQ